jgi:hypothetical protein
LSIIEKERSLQENIEKKTDNISDKPKPFVLSINICDSIIRDEVTKKVSLIGLFSIINSNVFPCIHPLLHVYVALTNGHGKYNTEIRFSHMDDREPIAGMTGELDFKNPLQVFELNICWQQLRFSKPGEYIVQVLCEGAVVGERKFRVNGPQQKMPAIDENEVR